MSLNERFQPLQDALVNAFSSQKELKQVSQFALNRKLDEFVDTNQSLTNIMFDFVTYLDTNELVENFIRGALRENNHSSLHQFVVGNIDFLLTYREKSLSQEDILRHKSDLSKNGNFTLVLKAFDQVLNQLKNIQKVNLSYTVEKELYQIRNSTSIPDAVRLFMLLEILINDYPLFSIESNESTLDKLDFYLKSEINPVEGSNKEKQRPYLQIVVQPGALSGQAILFAYLNFEKVPNKEFEPPEIIPIRYERVRKGENIENSVIKFSQPQAIGQILQFIREAEKEIERRQELGYEIDDPLIIEFFLPFPYLFQKIDRWTRPYGISTSQEVPLRDSYRIVFRSYERLSDALFRGSLRRRWTNSSLSNNSFHCLSKVDLLQNQSANILKNKVGIVSCLHQIEDSQENLISTVLEKGLPIVIWLEIDQAKTQPYLCEPQKCKNYLIQNNSLELEIGQEPQRCILHHLRELASKGGSLNDLHALYSSIQEIENATNFKGYFTILYDEPTRLFALASLFENEIPFGVSA